MGVNELLVGIDIGTTGTRCMIFDTTGRCVSQAYEEYPLIHLGAGEIEQSLPLMLETTADVCRQACASPDVSADAIVGVGLSSQMLATCPIDSSGELIRPMISWQDTRAVGQLAQIIERCPPDRFKAITGGPVMPQLLLAKILWLADNEPGTCERAVRWAQVQELALRFLGAEGFFLDTAQAAFTALWDVPNVAWSDELLAIAGLDASRLGQPVMAGTQVGEISRAAAERTGLRAGTPLSVGAGDQICAMVGMGAIRAGMGALTLGTAGTLQVALSEPRVDVNELFTINHAAPDAWIMFAPTLAAASSYRWFRDVFGQPERDAASLDGSDAFDHLNRLAADVPPGSDGLVFMPYLNSAGSPHLNPEASGAFVGITQSHDRAHFARAVMEGVALEMKDCLLTLEGYGLGPEDIRIGGGATRSMLWNQIQADVYGRSLQLLREGESTALGAAMLGGIGAGVFDGYDDCVASMVHVAETLDPDPEQHRLYTEVHAAFADAYDGLAAGTFSKISAFRASAHT